MNLLALVLCLIYLIKESQCNQLNGQKRIFCFTFIYFQSGPLFKQYLISQQPPKQKRRLQLQRQLVDQVEVCQQLIFDLKSEEQLKGIYDNQKKLVQIIKALRKVKQEHSIGNIEISLSEKQQQIIRDFASYSVMFQQLQNQKTQENQGEGQKEL